MIEYFQKIRRSLSLAGQITSSRQYYFFVVENRGCPVRHVHQEFRFTCALKNWERGKALVHHHQVKNIIITVVVVDFLDTQKTIHDAFEIQQGSFHTTVQIRKND